MLFNSWDKHDRKDAKGDSVFDAARRGSALYDPLVAGQWIAGVVEHVPPDLLARTRCQHSLLNHYLTLYFPEMERYYHNSRPNGSVASFSDIRRHDRSRVIENDVCKAGLDFVGRKVAKQRPKNCTSLQAVHGLPVEPDSLALRTFKLQLERFLALSEQRAALGASC